MTARWETEYSDGWQSIDLLSVSFLGGSFPPSKKQEVVILYLPQTSWPADLLAIRQARMQAI